MKLNLFHSFGLVLLLLYFPPTVKADFLITYGETVNFAGDLAKSTNTKQKVGFKYSYFGFFWLDLWTWDGSYCIYEPTSIISHKIFKVIDLQEAARITGKNESEFGKPFLYKYPLGLFLIIIVGLFGLIGASQKNQPPDKAHS